MFWPPDQSQNLASTSRRVLESASSFKWTFSGRISSRQLLWKTRTVRLVFHRQKKPNDNQCILYAFSTATHLANWEKFGQRNLEILVGETSDVAVAGVCGITSSTRMVDQAQAIDCSPGPLLGQYVTIRTTAATKLIVAKVKVKIQGYGYGLYAW